MKIPLFCFLTKPLQTKGNLDMFYSPVYNLERFTRLLRNQENSTTELLGGIWITYCLLISEEVGGSVVIFFLLVLGFFLKLFFKA